MFSLLLSFELAIKLTCALSIALPSAVSCALVLSPVFFLVTYLVLCLLFSLMLASAFSSVLSHALPRVHSSNLAIKLTSHKPRILNTCIHPENQRWVAWSLPMLASSSVASNSVASSSILQVIKLALGSQYSHSMITSKTA